MRKGRRRWPGGWRVEKRIFRCTTAFSMLWSLSPDLIVVKVLLKTLCKVCPVTAPRWLCPWCRKQSFELLRMMLWQLVLDEDTCDLWNRNKLQSPGSESQKQAQEGKNSFQYPRQSRSADACRYRTRTTAHSRCGTSWKTGGKCKNDWPDFSYYSICLQRWNSHPIIPVMGHDSWAWKSLIIVFSWFESVKVDVFTVSRTTW